jgi:hypothetical protein
MEYSPAISQQFRRLSDVSTPEGFVTSGTKA